MAITKKGYLRTNNAYVLITILVTQFVFVVKLLVQDVGFEVGLKNKVDFRIIACATAPMFWKKSAHPPLDSSYRSSFCMMGTRTRFIGITPGYCCCCYRRRHTPKAKLLWAQSQKAHRYEPPPHQKNLDTPQLIFNITVLSSFWLIALPLKSQKIGKMRRDKTLIPLLFDCKTCGVNHLTGCYSSFGLLSSGYSH